ncbi:unnamed protein product [Ilex paraguariensis]|uniref:F-box domain-containing protein n=1 Tax=Ilex paraguariensis TaxID=185542 RepID=A0ABC8SKM1_9AQUA
MSSIVSLSDLPQDTIVDILSRLPTKSIIHCRSVCRTWRNLILDPGFAGLHLSRSPTSLLIHQLHTQSNVFKLIELEDEHDHHGLCSDPVMKFDLGACLPNVQIISVGSVNGFVCLCQYNPDETIYIFNPTMREYVTLPKTEYIRRSPMVIDYGFGFSPVSGHYKVVQFCQQPITDTGLLPYSYKIEGKIYTLGTGRWRNIESVPFSSLGDGGVYFNGFLHWVSGEFGSPASICCFDVEKEVFRTVSSPPQITPQWKISLGLVGGCLSVCDNTSKSELVIWVMKEYGVNDSWTKKIVIRMNPDIAWLSYQAVHAIKMWKDGDIFMFFYDDVLFSYSPQRKTLEKHDFPKDYARIDKNIEVMLHVESFRSLREFSKEKITVF